MGKLNKHSHSLLMSDLNPLWRTLPAGTVNIHLQEWRLPLQPARRFFQLIFPMKGNTLLCYIYGFGISLIAMGDTCCNNLNRRIPALFSQPTLRVGALRNRLALRRQNAFARPRRVDTHRQARYIPLARPTQGPGNNDDSPQVLSRPRRVDAPQQPSHQAEEEVCNPA